MIDTKIFLHSSDIKVLELNSEIFRWARILLFLDNTQITELDKNCFLFSFFVQILQNCFSELWLDKMSDLWLPIWDYWSLCLTKSVFKENIFQKCQLKKFYLHSGSPVYRWVRLRTCFCDKIQIENVLSSANIKNYKSGIFFSKGLLYIQ